MSGWLYSWNKWPKNIRLATFSWPMIFMFGKGAVWSTDSENRTPKVWKSIFYPIEPKNDQKVHSPVAWERDTLIQIGLNERVLR